MNVTRALRSAVERIAAHDEALGPSPAYVVRTGMFCVYEPGPGRRGWDVDSTPERGPARPAISWAA